MEIDARTIREVEFREKIRGYNPDDVDDFLEQVAVAFESIEDRLRDGQGQLSSNQPMPAAQPEARDIRTTTVISPPMERSRPSQDSSEFDADTIQRTMLLAQKTADETIRSAEERAEATEGEAKAKAESLVNQAMNRAREIVDDAVNQARDEVLEMAKSKDKLLAELSHLNSRLASAKDQMKHLLEGVMEQIDGSFDPVVRGTQINGQQGEFEQDDTGHVLVQSSKEAMSKEPVHNNGSGVFDDELD